MDNVYTYLSSVTDTQPDSPGGGSVACMTLAFATATLKKVFYFSRNRLTEEEIAAWSKLETYSECVRLAEDDTWLFCHYMATTKATENKEQKVEKARKQLAAHTTKLTKIGESLISVAEMFTKRGNKALINDTLLAKELAETALKTIRRNAEWNKETNV